MANSFAHHLRTRWVDVRAKLIELVRRLEPADLAFRPYADAWTVRELVLHIAHEEHGEVQHGIARALPAWPDGFEGGDSATVAELAARLDEVHAATLKLLDGLDDEALLREMETPWGARDSMLGLLEHVIEHEVHHRAELSLILAMLGKPGLDA